MKKIEAIIERSKAKGYENFLQECECCMERDCCDTCSFFEVTGHYACEVNACLEELNEEYGCISEKEYHLLRYLSNGWIARDSNSELYWYPEEPHRQFSFSNGREVYVKINKWGVNDRDYLSAARAIEPELFPFITWDSEAFKVEDLLLLPIKY